MGGCSWWSVGCDAEVEAGAWVGVAGDLQAVGAELGEEWV